MNGKLHKNIGFSLLPFAFLFLFEPGYAIIDPLPDFIGYIIICCAIINLADINPRITEALGGFRKGILISILRIISIYLLENYFLSDAVGLLLFTFVFAFFELVILIPAYRQLFEGLLSLGMLHNGTGVYLKKLKKKKKLDKESGEVVIYVKESKRNVTEKAYTMTAVFLFIRAAAMTLPEFTTLISNSSYEFIKLLRFFGLIIATPIGIVWLIKMLSYCAKIRKDSPFIRELSEIYVKNAKENPNFYVVRNLSSAIYTVLFAFVISSDFYSDYINLLPDFLFYIVIAVAAILAHRFSKKWKALLATAIVSGIFNAILHFITVDFHNRFYPAAIKKNLEAYNLFYSIASLNIIDSILFVSTVLITVFVVWDIFKCHTDIALATSDKERNEAKTAFLKGAVPTLILAVLTAVGNVYYILAQPFYNSELWFFYYSNIITVLIALTFTFSSVFFISYVGNCIKYRYRSYI